jgi:Short C-terminal domain/Phospholipase_D-nuclease N-terminal
MTFGYDYPLLGFFWSVLMVFVLIAWIVLLIRVFADIFSNHEMGGGAKALWAIFVLIVPFLGVFIYLIVHGGAMASRHSQSMRDQDMAFDRYTPDPASGSAADELAKMADLRDKGVLSEEEFSARKARLLGG